MPIVKRAQKDNKRAKAIHKARKARIRHAKKQLKKTQGQLAPLATEAAKAAAVPSSVFTPPAVPDYKESKSGNTLTVGMAEAQDEDEYEAAAAASEAETEAETPVASKFSKKGKGFMQRSMEPDALVNDLVEPEVNYGSAGFLGAKPSTGSLFSLF